MVNHDLLTLLPHVGIEGFLNLVEWETVSDQAAYGKANTLGALEEVVGIRIISAVIDP